jgi:hypothetical protein
VFDFDPGVLRDAAAILLVVFGLLMICPRRSNGCRSGSQA